MDAQDDWGGPISIEGLPELCGSADEVSPGEPSAPDPEPS